MIRRFSIPFSLTLLALLGLIVAPLAGVLLWLGAETTGALEHRNVTQRMTGLSAAVEGFLRNGVEQIILMGDTLADTPGFLPVNADAVGTQAAEAADMSRLEQLAGLLGRRSLIAAAFVGYANGHFLYAGRADTLSAEQRNEYGAPADATIILRRIDGHGPTRRETWWLRTPDGKIGAPRSRDNDYDPRQRPWYVEAIATDRPVLTEPYVFANADVMGISAGLPLPNAGGVFGYDITLDTLSTLIAAYKLTPNSVVMVGGPSGTLAQSRACAPSEPGCLPGGAEARAALEQLMRQVQVQAEGGRNRQRARIGASANEYELYVDPMPVMFDRTFVVAAAVPVSELSVTARALLRRSALAAAAVIAVAVLAALAGSLLLSRPLTQIARKTERIRQLDFSDRRLVQSRIREVMQLSQSVERMRDGLHNFGRYVSRGLVEQIMHSPEATGMRGVNREVTVMFTDIEGFSRIAERLRPEVLTRRLSHYFETLEPAIAGNHGTIDKYIGDSIMAYWNAPQTDDDHVFHACRAAVQAAAASRTLAGKWQSRGRPAFRTRFGLHTGGAVVGNVGTRERINYTLVGPVANQASRLEGLNKVYGTDVLASGDVRRLAGDRFVWRAIDRVVAAGTTEPHDLHEPLALSTDEDASAHAAFLEKWDAARADYVAGRFNKALMGFRAAQEMRPQDGPSRVFIARCTAFEAEGVPAGWDGVWRFDHK